MGILEDLAAIPSYFQGNSKPGDPLSYEALQTRRKIAEQLMGKRSPFPKTFGEGLTYAGERFADVMDERRLDAAEKQQAAYEKNVLSGGPPLPGAENTAVAPASPPSSSAAAPPAASSSPTYFPPAAGVNEIPIPPPRPVLNRSQFQGEMDANPTLAAKMQTIVQGEVGRGASEQEKKIQLEEIFNRAAARGQTLEQVTRQYTGPGSSGYYPASTFQHGQARGPEEYQDFQRRIMTPVLRGSDVGGQTLGFSPTGNASGDVAASGVRRGYYTEAGKLPGGAETYVQHRPDNIALLNATRVPGRDAIARVVADQAEPANAMPAAPAVPYTDFTGLGATPPAPVRTAALTAPGVASDAGSASAIADGASTAVAALPVQQQAQTPPLVPGSGPPIVTPEIKPIPVAQAAPGTIPLSQAGAAVPPPISPRDPGPQPTMPPPTQTMNWLDSIARNRGLSPETRADAQSKYNNLLKVQHDVFINDLKTHKEQVTKFQDPATALALRQAQLGVVKAVQDLEGEGWRPVPAEKMAQLPKVAEGQTYWENRRGELKFGPRPPASTTVNIDQKAEGKGLERLQTEMADHIVGQFKDGNTAADDLRTISSMRVLAARVDTGAIAVAKQFAGRFGIKTEGISDIEALNATIKRIVPQQRVPGTGATSDFDAHMFEASVPGLMLTKEGNNLIMDTMENVARNKLARAEVAGKVISGELKIGEGTKELLKLQAEAKTMSDNVRSYLENTGVKLPATIIPSQADTDNAARKWLENNPNDRRAPAVRQKLGL